MGDTTSVPAPGGGWLVTSNHYDGATSRILCQTRTGQPDTLYSYHPDGTPHLAALDLDLDGAVSLSGPDRVTGASSAYEQDASNLWWHVTRRHRIH